jgi:hypothetical protein
MSRSRNIKPGFFKNEDLAGLPFWQRLLYIGLWTECDREGRCEDRPVKLKMALFPADNVEVEEGLQALHDNGFILRYNVGNRRFIQVIAWHKHQNPHFREQGSVIPSPESLGLLDHASPAKPEADTCIDDDEAKGETEAYLRHEQGLHRADPTLKRGVARLIPDSLIPDSLQEQEREGDAREPDDGLPPQVDRKRWKLFLDQQASDGKLSISRIKTATMQLHALIADGHDPNVVLEASVMRGMRDLKALAAQLRSESKRSSHTGPPALRVQPPTTMSKTLQALHTLEAAKNAPGLDNPGNQLRIAKADPSQP